MTTTSKAKPRNPARTVVLVVLGVLFGLPAFMFGATVIVLALIGGVRRWRLGAFAAGQFVTVAVCVALHAGGWNPWVSYVESQARDHIESSTKGSIEWDLTEANLLTGEVTLRDVSWKQNEDLAEAEIEILVLNLAPGLLPFGSISGEGSNASVTIDATTKALDAWMRSLDAESEQAFDIVVEDVEVNASLTFETGGPQKYALGLRRLHAQNDAELRLDLGVRAAELGLMDRQHNVNVQGGFSVVVGDETRVLVDASVRDPEIGHAYLRGGFGSGDQIDIALDTLDFGALWARYRIIDRYRGDFSGKARIHGTFDDVRIDMQVAVEDFEYFHKTVMAMDESQSFRMKSADLVGGLRYHDGLLSFDRLTMDAPEATLATGDALNATGRAKVQVNGAWNRVDMQVHLIVTEGTLNAPISFSPLSSRQLSDVEPNLVLVAEQFPWLDLKAMVTLKNLAVNADPISGVLEGELLAELTKRPERREGVLRADGELTLTDGKFNFQGATGDVTGKIVFTPNEATPYARIEGNIDAKAGDMPVRAKIHGALARPALRIQHMDRARADYSKQVMEAGASELTDEQRRARESQLRRVCGPSAATTRDPFEVRKTGKLILGFSTGE